MKYRVTLIHETGKDAALALDDAAWTVVYGLRALGHEVEYAANIAASSFPTILFGVHQLPHGIDLPAKTILYNFEQYNSGVFPTIREYGKKYAVWDYSARNVRHWRSEYGIYAQHVPLGYVPELSRVPVAAKQDIDVLFYGSRNLRRTEAITEIGKRKLHTMHLLGVWGPERDAYIARSKVCLNVHFYESMAVESPRLAFLLANKKAIVSERSQDDDPRLEDGMVVVGFNELAEACAALVGNETRRRLLEEAGFALFSQQDEKEILTKALEAK